MGVWRKFFGGPVGVARVFVAAEDVDEGNGVEEGEEAGGRVACGGEVGGFGDFCFLEGAVVEKFVVEGFELGVEVGGGQGGAVVARYFVVGWRDGYEIGFTKP